MNTFVRLQFLALLIAIISFTTFAYTSSQTGQPAGGEGAGTISGWTVSGIHYSLAEGSALVSSVEFDLDKPAGTVRVALVSESKEFFPCSNPTATHWVCDLQSQSHLSVLDQFRVIAIGGGLPE